jgi:hypothetical protein
MHEKSGDEDKGDHVMKQIKERVEELFVAMIFICIVLLGMAANIFVSMADLMRSWKRRKAPGADASCAMIPQ